MSLLAIQSMMTAQPPSSRARPARPPFNPVRRLGYCVAALCLLPAGQGAADGLAGAVLAGKMSMRLEMLYSKAVGGGEAAPAAHAGKPASAASAGEGAAPSQDPWRILRDDRTVLVALSRWAAREGWQVVWELPVDYPVVAEASLSGSFEDAVEALVLALQSVSAPPRVVFYAGNRIVRVLPRGAQ